MKKEPIGLYIFRLVVGFGMLIFMGMLYWSSNLIEHNILSIHNDFDEFKNELSAIRDDIKTLQASGLPETPSMKNVAAKKSVIHALMDPNLPNLLSEDPFYQHTLPQLLGANFSPHGKFQNASITKPENLHPFNNWVEVNTWIGMCQVSLSRLKFGIYETFAPDSAVKIEARPRADGTSEYWVFLRDNVFWQPLNESMFENKVNLAPEFTKKHQVTAADYKFYFDALMNPFVQESGAVALRNYLGDISEIEIKDDLTFVVRWNSHLIKDHEGKPVAKIRYLAKSTTGGLKPLPVFVYQYFPDGSKIIEDDGDPKTYRTNSVWAQNFARHWAKNIIVSCGPWVFTRMNDRQINFVRNHSYYIPYDALALKNEWEFKNSTDAVWQDFKIGRLDTYDLPPNQLIEWDNFQKSDMYHNQVDKGSAIKRLDYPANLYFYIGWNQATSYFKSQKVRLAMTQAINRPRIIEQILNGLGMEISGPFLPGSSEYDKSIAPWPYDVEAAKRLLEEEGWYDMDGDGILDKMIDGKKVPFRFRLTYYVRDPIRKAVCEYVATALKEIGIVCSLNGVDIADLSAAFEGKTFDAVFMGWGQGTPPSDPRQLWHSAGAKEPGSSNAVGFANAEADEIIEKLTFEDNPEKRKALYHRFHAIIHEEQPYTFMYQPKIAFLYRERVQNVFIPADRQDLVPGADITQPISSVFWLKTE